MKMANKSYAQQRDNGRDHGDTDHAVPRHPHRRLPLTLESTIVQGEPVPIL